MVVGGVGVHPTAVVLVVVIIGVWDRLILAGQTAICPIK